MKRTILSFGFQTGVFITFLQYLIQSLPVGMGGGG
jgi:hypothetical protein